MSNLCTYADVRLEIGACGTRPAPATDRRASLLAATLRHGAFGAARHELPDPGLAGHVANPTGPGAQLHGRRPGRRRAAGAARGGSALGGEHDCLPRPLPPRHPRQRRDLALPLGARVAGGATACGPCRPCMRQD